jgi:hypothetical protein
MPERRAPKRRKAGEEEGGGGGEEGWSGAAAAAAGEPAALRSRLARNMQKHWATRRANANANAKHSHNTKRYQERTVNPAKQLQQRKINRIYRTGTERTAKQIAASKAHSKKQKKRHVGGVSHMMAGVHRKCNKRTER